MKNRGSRIVALLLTVVFTLPFPQVVAFSQEPATTPNQEKAQTESPESKKLRQAEEKQRKKDEQQRKREAQARAAENTRYRTLTEFSEDLYASNPLFRERIDEAYLALQSRHASEAYRINISTTKERLATENQGEVLTLRRALYDNPRVQEYVNRLGQQIVPEDSDKLYSFKVTVNPIPQAYTLSTGTVLVSTGMISLLDNEAQLAYVLAHELAHVYKDHWRVKVMLPFTEPEYNRRQAEKQRMWTELFTLAGAGIGGVIAGAEGAKEGMKLGADAGNAVGSYYSKRIALDWNVAQENEADDFALRATLGKSFDIQEVPRLYTTMAQVAQSDNRTQLGFLGARARIKERKEYAQQLISGALQAKYQDALKANMVKGTSPDFNLIMAELKRDNGIEAFYFDMFHMAKMNLQQSVMLRSDDPLAAYYYGRVLKQVGRTKEELDLAQQSLIKAISLDVRQDIPEVQLHRALMLMDSRDSGNQIEAVAALKNYITSYGRRRAVTTSNDLLLPPNVDVLYGYMRVLGEKTWTAPSRVELQRSPSANPAGSNTQPISPPAVETAPQTVKPTKTKQTRKP